MVGDCEGKIHLFRLKEIPENEITKLFVFNINNNMTDSHLKLKYEI